MAWLRRLTPAWWLTASAGACIFALDLHGELNSPGSTAAAYAFLMAMFVLSVTGFVVWAVRPEFNPLGALWTIFPIVHVVENLPAVYPTSKAATTVGYLLLGTAAVMGAQFIMSYPTGKPFSRWATIWLVVAYTGGILLNVPYVLYLPSYLYVGAPPVSLESYNDVVVILWLVPIVLTALLLYVQRLRTIPPGARRTVVPLIGGAIAYALIWTYLTIRQLWHGSAAIAIEQEWLNTVFLSLFSVVALVGLFFTRRARGAVGDLVLDLGRLGPGGLQPALARALGDPTLRVGYWRPSRGVWTDDDGAELDVPASGDRTVTYLGDQLAVMIHDPDLRDQPALLEAVRSAAGYALENERLRAELMAQLAELRESRARIVRTADAERRRLERDLHDGAQQRLLGLGMALQLLQVHVDRDGEALLEESQAELQQALHELRELARGIHPAILTDSGLTSAIETLAQRAPLPVVVSADGERLPPPVETAAYYVVAEALANIARYAQANEASVSVRRHNGVVRIDVRDDGVGGADPGGGTGLRGLADRVGALNGHLRVHSPAGQGTHLAAEFPCEP